MACIFASPPPASFSRGEHIHAFCPTRAASGNQYDLLSRRRARSRRIAHYSTTQSVPSALGCHSSAVFLVVLFVSSAKQVRGASGITTYQKHNMAALLRQDSTSPSDNSHPSRLPFNHGRYQRSLSCFLLESNKRYEDGEEDHL